MNQAKLPKNAAILAFAVFFLIEAAFHGFVQHNWSRAVTDVVSIFFAAFVYWFVRFVWIKIGNAFRARNDRKSGHQ